MQGALKVSIAVVMVAGVAPAAASAQVLNLPPVEVPSVSVPPVALPAPLPQVSTPQVSTHPVSVPGVRVDAPLPSVPQVQAPMPPPAPPPPAPRAATPVPQARPGADALAPATSSGQAPSGATAAPAGTPSASPARSRAARVVALRAGRGVLGTSYRSPRRLVRALRACVPGLPERQERLLVMRYGIGAAASHPDRAVASALGLSRGEYTTVRGRALRGLVRDARSGGCRDGAPSSAAPVIAFDDGGEVRSVAALSRAGSSLHGGAEIAVRGERASGGSERLDEEGGELATPLALDADEPAGSLLGALMLAAAIAVLALIALRGLTAGSRP